MTDPVNLPALREAVALLAKPGRLEISAVFKPFVREQDVFVRSEDGSFGLRLVRPETGEEAVLDFNALPALLDELEAARAVLETAENSSTRKAHQVWLVVDRAAWLKWRERQFP